MDNKIIEDNIKMEQFLPGIFRYAVLLILYIVCFLYLYHNSTQFILFIVIFILNFFTIVFLYTDFIAIPDLANNLFGDSDTMGSGFTKMFTFAILITLTLNIITFGMILSVFDYGKKSTIDYLSYTMTPQNTQLLTEFKGWYYWYMIYLGFLAFFVAYSHTTGKLKIMLQNLLGSILSIVIIVISSYQCSLAVKFLDNIFYKRQLYQ
jgi:hypothetical protein